MRINCTKYMKLKKEREIERINYRSHLQRRRLIFQR